VTVNLRPRFTRFDESEYDLLLKVLEASRQRLGFLLCGYVLMPDHWRALVQLQQFRLGQGNGGGMPHAD